MSRIFTVVALTGSLWPAIAAAQTTTTTTTSRAPSPPSESRWELQVYGGLSVGQASGGGRVTLPPAGAPIATSSPVFPAWSVPTWFLGDGAAFLNNVAGEFGVTARITPLDDALRFNGTNAAGHGLAGVRLTHLVRGDWSVEIGLDLTAQPAGFSRDFLSALDSASSTFKTTFGQVLATGPFAAPIVTSAVTTSAGSSRDVTLTAALSTRLRGLGSFGSYALAGAGIVLPAGDPAVAVLAGRYRFQIAGSIPIDETDNLTIRFRDRSAFVAVAGGGLRRPFSNRWGVVVDGRVLIGPATKAIEVNSSPASVTATPAGFIESFTYPNLQFSNNATTGRRSTLGAPGLEDFEVFSGGWVVRGRVTAGIYFSVR